VPVAAKTSLDSFDRKILDCLQGEADMPLAEIARKVGLSTTPCWRRINRLQADGIIRARVALLDRRALNAGVTVFVAVRTAQHNAQWLTRFAKAVASFPEVMDCYRMSGEIDYLIRLALPDIDAYDAFYKRLIAKIELSDVTSMFAMEEIKSTTRLPLSYLP
jgi:Lrp/AsnC family transcriptional regulator